ncbi:MAG: valine--tRNA ligase, partial [Proteobacteria bacterium]|nr:valine--tRNA ligase [Pseudomonadota bacterium]
TMLGDTAVAVNPDDERYHGLEFRQVILPLMNKKIPIIQDKYVDMSFGTGALKITPAHDPNDFEIGNRHNLERVKVIGDNGRMTAEAGRFEGLDRFECRNAVVKALEDADLLVKVAPYHHSVGHCYRCDTVIEPNLSEQWFVKAKPLAEKAIEAVNDGRTKIVPDVWTKTYFEWMNNIKDWCVSRQIWWGHQIPAWTCASCKEVIVAMESPQTCPACNANDLVQDDDVLDTWFSSALWPFSTMGWPEQTALLKTFYPTSVLVTGFDILFFWVARMMMMGLYCMGEVPFEEVYVHALVRDEDGKKMSKSTGNVIDPLSVIDQYGTDAFRFTLAAFAAQGRDVKMSEKRVEGYRHFINKIWNAARFCLMHLKKEYTTIDRDHISLPDRWILARLKRTTDAVAGALDAYRFNEAAGALYKFIWHEFCDWYLEAIKPTLYGQDKPKHTEATLSVLWRVLRDTLILLHPFAPFITEELWHKLPGTQGSVMQAIFPSEASDAAVAQYDDVDSEAKMDLIAGIITGVRNIRGEMNISPSLMLAVSVQSLDEVTRQTVTQHQDLIINLARLKSFSVEAPGERPRSAATAIVNGATVFVSLGGIIDFEKEILRLEKEIGKLSNELMPVSKKLNNEDFLKKAPGAVVDKVKEKYDVLVEKHQKLMSNLDRIKEYSA